MTTAPAPSLWDWALRAYERPGAAEACLALQDRFDQSVPFLLFAAWSAATGRDLDSETLEAAADTARAYEAAIVRPLRGVRRTLKAPLPDIDDGPREALRAQVKAVELEAERRLIEALAGLAAAPDSAPRPILDGLVEAARTWSRVTPRADLERLAATLSP